MKLLQRRVERAERAMAAGGVREPVALVWSENATRAEPGPEDLVAVDVYVTGAIGGTLTWRTEERITRDPEDLGTVYDRGGRAVGRVRAVEGAYIDLDVGPGELAASTPK